MMKLITRQSKVEPAIEGFLKNYPFYKSYGGYWTEERLAAVSSLDPDTATPADVARVMNEHHVENRCDECEQDFDTLVQIGQEPDYDARWLCLCEGCLKSAASLLK